MADKKPSRKGEMRRRWRAFLDDGSLAALRSEGRLAALYVFYAADWSTCQVRMSIRKAARSMGVQATTIRRGISQMVSGGILEVLERSEGGGKTLFRVSERAQGVRAPDTGCARGRAQGVRAPDTPCARPAHEPCAPRAHSVRAPRTLCARNSFLFSGSPVRTSEELSDATPGAGAGPAQASVQIDLPPDRHAAG